MYSPFPFRMDLERARHWLERWGNKVDLCSHVNTANFAEHETLYGYAEDDSFGPVARAIFCKSCGEKEIAAVEELMVSLTNFVELLEE